MRLEIKVAYSIGDRVRHIVSKKELLVVGYKYIESQGIQYIVIDDMQKELYAIPYELEGKIQENNVIGFIY